jgi:hypothetical protein
MHSSIQMLIGRLPLSFRVLYRQFLLRIVDLEALSIDADIPRFFGQFAGVLIMFSVIQAFAAFISTWSPTTPETLQSLAWQTEQRLISTTMLVVGLIAVITWDSTFPDRRDAMVLSPLPIKPHTILFAKIAASATTIGLAVLTLNVLSGLAWPLVLGIPNGGFVGFLRFLAAYWFSTITASAFIFCAVLTVQGLTALLLPRRIYLHLSALLQIAAFALVLTVYFQQPYLDTPATLALPATHWIQASSPTFWFFALLNQLNCSLPQPLIWLAHRAWIALAAAVLGAGVSLLLCYLRTMRKTIEEPDLVPAVRGLHWAPHLGGSLRAAILAFTLRTLMRSRQHRLAFAFFPAVALALLPLFLNQPALPGTQLLMPLELIAVPYMIMSFAIVGLSKVFALPISLNANWVLRTTQMFPMRCYVAGTRFSLLLIAALPTWMLSAFLALKFRPISQVAVHLAILALLGFNLVDLSLVGFHKVPFTCSYLPGKTNFQLIFWASLIIFLPAVVGAAMIEQHALANASQFIAIIAALFATDIALWAFNRHRAEATVLHFEESPEEVITSLRLLSMPR